MKIMTIILFFFTSSPAFSSNAFEAFGQREGIEKMVETFYISLKADEKMRPFFKHTEKEKFIKNFTDQVCEELGGPCQYKGQSMFRAHKGHAITRANFFQLVEVFQKAMRAHEIPNWAQNKILSKFAPMHKDIVSE